MPEAEVDIDEALVRGLLDDQFPDLAGLPITYFESGWDSELFRLGDDLVVRLPRRELAAQLVLNEQRWLPDLAPRLPLPIPTPMRAGRPGRGYPWAWSVCRWFDGECAARTPPRDPFEAATSIGWFIAALHVPAPDDAPPTTFRGGPLSQKHDVLLERLDHLHDVVDRDAVLVEWEHALAARTWSGPPLWLHGDLHPANVLVDNGVITAIVDFGDITAGDPATDLAIAWMLLPSGARPTLRQAAGDVDDDTWARAKGWALSLSIAYLAFSANNPLIGGIGERTLAAVLNDPD